MKIKLITSILLMLHCICSNALSLSVNKSIVTHDQTWTLLTIESTSTRTICHWKVTSKNHPTTAWMTDGVYIEGNDGRKYNAISSTLPNQDSPQIIDANKSFLFDVVFPAIPQMPKYLKYYSADSFYIADIQTNGDQSKAYTSSDVILYELREKANNGDVNAMFALGMMFLHGLGVMRSLEYALPWFQKAQALGDARAKNVIAQWDKLKKKYEKKSTKTTVDVVDDDSLSWLVYVVIVVAAIAGLFVLMFTIKGCENSAGYAETVDTVCCDTSAIDIAERNKVSIVGVQSSIGTYDYLGEVNSDVPDGYGEAWFEDGRYYKGYFTNGNLNGSCTIFRYDNGDSFEGTFTNNEFDTGTYTIAKDGSCFVGSFKGGQPEKGVWYDKNGNIIEEL